VTFESFSSEVVHRTLSNDLAIWRNLWTDNAALARDALAFTKAGLRTAAERAPTAGVAGPTRSGV
jgi:D-psicose/D-tagatose/L-ribulose 3-epimerase